MFIEKEVIDKMLADASSDSIEAQIDEYLDWS